MQKFDMTKSIWFERYKPQTVQDLLIPQDIKEHLTKCINGTIDFPHFGFWSAEPGLGKSSSANAIIRDLGCEALWINASLEKGIDLLRDKIKTFASHASFDGNFKIVVMDECLEENEYVILLDNEHKEIYVKLKDLKKGTVYKCLSFNKSNGQFEDDTCEIISDKCDSIFQVTLDDNRTIKVTGDHPFIIEENGKFIKKTILMGLNRNDNLVFKGSKSKIKSITFLKNGRVINLTVHKNHTFITKNGIVVSNCDNISRDSQFAFRGFIDEFSQNCRFIFTGNYKKNIIDPLLDRLINYDFADFSQKELAKPIFERLSFILKNEKIQYDPKVLANVIYTFRPKIRSMIGFLQKSCKDGVLDVKTCDLDNLNSFDIVLKNVKNFDLMLNEVNKLNSPNDMYSYIYKNAEKYFNNYPQVILICAKYQSYSENVRDKHLNLSACLVELTQFSKF